MIFKHSARELSTTGFIKRCVYQANNVIEMVNKFDLLISPFDPQPTTHVHTKMQYGEGVCAHRRTDEVDPHS